MQVSLHASGTPSDVRSQLAAQITKEKARVSAASGALDGISAFVEADIAHVPADENIAVSVSVTVHRSDPKAEDKTWGK